MQLENQMKPLQGPWIKLVNQCLQLHKVLPGRLNLWARWCLIITTNRYYLSNLSTYQNNFSVQSHKQQGQPLCNNIDNLFNEFGYTGGRKTSMNPENHEVVQHTNNYREKYKWNALKVTTFWYYVFSSSIKSSWKNNTGFSFVERFFMEFALSKNLLIFLKYFLMLAMAKRLKKSIWKHRCDNVNSFSKIPKIRFT